MANSLSHTLNRAANDRLEPINIHLEDVGDGTFNAELKAPYGYIINNLASKLEAGSCSVAIKINGVNVTGLSAVAATTNLITSTATAANVVAAGDRLTFVITNTAGGAAKLGLTINTTRNGSEGA